MPFAHSKGRGVFAAAGLALVAMLVVSCAPAGSRETAARAPLTQSPLSSSVPWVAKLGTIGGSGCTVYILTDHWVMGVRHCFNAWATAASYPIIYTTPTGVQQIIYDGPGVVRIYPGTNADDDIGLLYLVNGLGANLSLTGQAKLYTDARHPWCSTSDPNDLVFWIAGYGLGTDPGGSNNCDDASATVDKRMNSFVMQTGFCSGSEVWSQPSEVHGCPGDSGAPWLLQRDGEYLAFAHTAWGGSTTGSTATGAVLLQPYLRWIRDTSADVDPAHALWLNPGTTASGYAYGTFAETPSDPGTMVGTGSLAVASRTGHTASLLPGGKVLVAGGFNRTPYVTVLASTEIYDPATGTFTAGPSLGSPRYDHQATTLSSGKVLISGGSDGTTWVAGAVLYDPTSNTITSTGTMQTPRYDFTATVLPGGRVLVAGGVGAAGVLSSAELYDPTTGLFTTIGNTLAARQSPTATLLASGKVLITGGYDSTGALLASAELYDPVAGTFTATGTMVYGHAVHSATLLSSGKVLIFGYPGPELYDPATGTFTATGVGIRPLGMEMTATLLPSGKVLITGGYAADASIDRSIVYDPATDSFLPSATMSVPRSAHTATLLNDGRVLLAGGFNYQGVPANWTALATAELYDPRPFVATAGMSTNRAFHTATLLPGGQVLIAAGASSVALGQVTELSSALLFTPGASPYTGKFTSTGSLSFPRYAHTATMLGNGLALVVGGYSSTYGYLTSSELYDPSRGTFSASGPLTSARYWHTATLLSDGRVLVTGGYNSTSGPLASAEVYDPKRKKFSPAGVMVTPRYAHQATLLKDGTVLVTGGYNSTGYLRTAEVYDPVLMKFTATAGSMSPNPRAFHTATLLSGSGKVLVAGGVAADGAYYLATAELYDPATQTFSSLGLMNPGVGQGRASHQAVELPNGKVLITGGRTAASAPDIATALLFEPTNATFSAVGTMTSARPCSTATLLSDNKTVLIPGGWSSQTGYLSTAELYR